MTPVLLHGAPAATYEDQIEARANLLAGLTPPDGLG